MKKNIGSISSFKELLVFALPSIVMMIFMSSYTIVDGFFVSTYVGNDAFAALSLVYPLISIFIAIGVMFATGGSALVAKFFGERDEHTGNRIFTSLYFISIIFALLGLIFSIIFIKPLLSFLGTDNNTYQDAKIYITIFLFFSPFAMIQMLFQSFFVVAGKPRLGLCLTIISGLANMILDYLFMGPLNMGIEGAAYATVIGYMMTAIPGTIYFFVRKKGLHFAKPVFNYSYILKSMGNGSSEMVTNLSTAITTLIFNALMLKFVGNDGVVAMSVILYCQYLFTSIFMGYSIGIAPVISYNFGAKKEEKIKYFAKVSYIFIAISSAFICLLTILIASLLAQIFSNNNETIYSLINIGLKLFAISFLMTGANIFSSAFFTALSDGFTSALLSFLRTFVFIIINIYLLSYFFEVTGLLLAIPVAEAITLILTAFIFKRQYSKSSIYMSELVESI